MSTGSYSYESMTLFVVFHKYPSVLKTCACLLSSGNDKINILHVEQIKKDVEYCMENAFSTYFLRLVIFYKRYLLFSQFFYLNLVSVLFM